jgi:hypothetical protein
MSFIVAGFVLLLALVAGILLGGIGGGRETERPSFPFDKW